MEVSNETADKLEEFSEENELDHDEVVAAFKEKYEEVEERAENVDEDYLESLALRAVRTAELAKFQSVEGVEMATIGGSIREWGDGQNARDVFVGKALVDTNPDEDGRKFLSTIIADADDGVDVGAFQDAFSEVGNIVTGEFSISDGFTDRFKVLNTSEDTDISINYLDERSDVISDIRDAVPETSISEIADDLSATERDEDTGNIYPANFGVDIRRMTVDVYDGYKKPESNFGMYTVRDDTVFDEDDIVASPVFDRDEAGDNATPGLTCLMDLSQMKYGKESVIEVFGVVEKNQNGIVQMNVDGVIPILKEGEFDGYVDEGESGSPEREESSSNVDRKNI